MDIITAATILMSVANLNSNSSSFAYNAEINDSIVKSETVYSRGRSGKELNKHLKYFFTYDSKKRLVKKEILIWNAENDEWGNKCCYTFTYMPVGYEMDFACWDGNSHAYDKNREKQVYLEYTKGSEEIYSYKWDNLANGWQETSRNLFLRSNRFVAETDK